MTYIGTTHSSPHNGHGRKVPRVRFAIPIRAGVRDRRGNVAPWFIKPALSRPVEKRPLSSGEVA